MDISVQKKSPLSLREQIKRQIRMLIECGDLELGQALPSARDLSAILNVNRNTITHAYKELSSEGILKIVIGSGTFVKEGLALKPKKELDQVFEEAILNAKRFGFRTDEITEHFLNRLSALTADYSKKRILVVDCNDEVVSYLCDKLSEEFGVQAEGVLIQELEMDRKAALAFFKDKDLVVCGFNHLEELKSAVPHSNVEVVAVLFHVDAKVINALIQLPEGTRVGCVCANQRSTETFYNSAYFSGGKELKRILAGYDNSKKLEKVVRECDVIFATYVVYDRMKELVRPHQKLINVNITVDSSNMDLIRERVFK
jgi:DNA-binding transcriptional regulator YhcF (GntR family)